MVDLARGTGHRTTISAVAEAAGVSIATVSKVVNRRTGVGETTRTRVLGEIERLGYVSIAERQIAYANGADATFECLIAFDEDAENPYYSTLLRGVIRGAERLGVSLVLRPPAMADASPMDWAQGLARSGRAGVIEVTSAFSASRERALKAVGLPMVLVDPLDVPRTSTPSVGATNWSGGYTAARHLLELGHTRIAYIGGPPTAGCDHARAHGWAAAMVEAGLPADVNEAPRHSYTFEHGVRAGCALLERPDRPTAIFAGADPVALGVLEAARQLGLSVPDDVSVIGFDDTALARTSSPPLTTIHQPIMEIGSTAVANLLRLAAGESFTTKRVELSTHLVVRQTTAAPSRGKKRTR